MLIKFYDKKHSEKKVTCCKIKFMILHKNHGIKNKVVVHEKVIQLEKKWGFRILSIIIILI